MEDLTIDKAFDDLCPALSHEEYRLLKAAIIADGCLHPIVVWANHQDTILDGHNRYRICREHEIPFKTKALTFKTREEAEAWIIRNQLGRRNLNDGARAMLAAKLANLAHGGDRKSDQAANLPLENQASAAEEFGVSERTVRSARAVIDHGTKDLQKAVEAGEVAVSVAASVAELPKAEQRKIVAKGPEAVKAAAKKVKADKPPKQYKDTFDTAELDKKRGPKNGRAVFNDKAIDDLFGKISRALDERKQAVGGLGSLYGAAHDALSKAITAWRALRA